VRWKLVRVAAAAAVGSAARAGAVVGCAVFPAATGGVAVGGTMLLLLSIMPAAAFIGVAAALLTAEPGTMPFKEAAVTGGVIGANVVSICAPAGVVVPCNRELVAAAAAAANTAEAAAEATEDDDEAGTVLPVTAVMEGGGMPSGVACGTTSEEEDEVVPVVPSSFLSLPNPPANKAAAPVPVAS